MTQGKLFDGGSAVVDAGGRGRSIPQPAALRALNKRVTDNAIAQAEGGAPPEWLAQARKAVHLLACRQAEFTTDDIWEILGAGSAPEPRALGAIMRSAVHACWCEATDRTRRSTRTICHQNPKRVWRSLIFGAEPAL